MLKGARKSIPSIASTWSTSNPGIVSDFAFNAAAPEEKCSMIGKFEKERKKKERNEKERKEKERKKKEE